MLNDKQKEDLAACTDAFSIIAFQVRTKIAVKKTIIMIWARGLYE